MHGATDVLGERGDVLEQVDGSLDVPLCRGQRLAGVARLELRDLIDPLPYKCSEPAQPSRTLARREVAPDAGLVGGPGARNSPLHVLGLTERDIADGLAGRRIHSLERAT